MLPLQRERRLTALADALGIEVVRPTARWPTPRPARACCARCSRACAPTRPRWPRRSAPSPPRRPRAGAPGAARARAGPARLPASAGARPDFGELPKDPGVYLFRDRTAGSSTWASRSRSEAVPGRISLPRRHRRAGPRMPAIVDYRTTRSELGALVLENRLIKELAPPGNTRLTGHDDRLVYIRCRLDIPFPILEVAATPRRPRGHDRADARAPAGARARGAAGLAVRPAPLRPAAAAPRVSLGLRPDGALPVAVPGRPRSQPVPAPPRRGPAPVPAAPDGRGGRCSTTSRRRCAPRAEQRFERAAALRRRPRRLDTSSAGSAASCEATHAQPRLVLVAIPAGDEREAFWVAGGRLVDSGPIASSTSAATGADRGGVAAQAAPESWAPTSPGRDRRGADPRQLAGLASGHAQLALERPPPGAALAALWTRGGARQRWKGSSTTTARISSVPTATYEPGGASRRTRASPTGPEPATGRRCSGARPCARRR